MLPKQKAAVVLLLMLKITPSTKVPLLILTKHQNCRLMLPNLTIPGTAHFRPKFQSWIPKAKPMLALPWIAPII